MQGRQSYDSQPVANNSFYTQDYAHVYSHACVVIPVFITLTQIFFKEQMVKMRKENQGNIRFLFIHLLPYSSIFGQFQCMLF